MAHFMEIGVDDEVYEIEVRLEDIYYKCCRCGKRQYGGFYFEAEAEMRCKTDNPPEAQFLCRACGKEEQNKLRAKKRAMLVSKYVSKKVGKKLPVETALEWVDLWDEERFRCLEREFLSQNNLKKD